MNMLIIGNGFDLAHGRPTKYEDFLKFTEQILRTKSYQGTKEQFESTMPDLHTDIKKYILSAFDTTRGAGSNFAWNKNEMIQEIYECLDKNVWYEYFQLVYKNEIHGKNWIDFEGEICKVIEFFDRKIEDIYEQLPVSLFSLPSAPICKENEIREVLETDKDPFNEIMELFGLGNRQEDVHEQLPTSFSSLQSTPICKENKIREVQETDKAPFDEIIEIFSDKDKSIPISIVSFTKNLDFSEYNHINNKDDSYKNTYYDLVEKTYQDLEKLIRCLEIYLDNCVGKIKLAYFSTDIKELKVDSVLSFNYTTIPTNIYRSLTKVHYIHGYAKSKHPTGENNNMVLGVNEYWEGAEKNFRTNFNLYKKFVQRIIKETGIDYKKTLEKMYCEYESTKERHGENSIPPNPNNVYIFGHSLDITDGDILREVIQTPGVVTTIFYRNKQQQAKQIANLSKVLGQDELLERTFSTSPSIIFKQQAEMVSASSLKIASQSV